MAVSISNHIRSRLHVAFVMTIFIVGSVAGRFYITDLEGLEYAVRLPTLA